MHHRAGRWPRPLPLRRPDSRTKRPETHPRKAVRTDAQTGRCGAPVRTCLQAPATPPLLHRRRFVASVVTSSNVPCRGLQSRPPRIPRPFHPPRGVPPLARATKAVPTPEPSLSRGTPRPGCVYYRSEHAPLRANGSVRSHVGRGRPLGRDPARAASSARPRREPTHPAGRA